jgi:DNA polymerase-3 subunit beta
VRLSEERIEFSFSNLTVVSKLVEGTFPEYRRVVPANNENTIRISGKLLDAAINRVMTVNTSQGSGVRFTFEAETLRLTSKPGENGEAEDEVPVEIDAPIETVFNGEYMRAVIDALGGGDIVLKLGSPGDPAMIMKPGETKSFAILMPMRK